MTTERERERDREIDRERERERERISRATLTRDNESAGCSVDSCFPSSAPQDIKKNRKEKKRQKIRSVNLTALLRSDPTFGTWSHQAGC